MRSLITFHASEGLGPTYLCASVDVNKTKYNEKYFFVVCTICILAGTNRTSPQFSGLHFNAAL